uniref:Uncharacterized protein n=1 Tax=viral metagenome TaxID=1070528 RepID=A0A6M3L743_9ZZZZ
MKKRVRTEALEQLSELWVDACVELWDMTNDRPYLKDVATQWDAFRFVYMKMVEPDGSGRRSLGEA